MRFDRALVGSLAFGVGLAMLLGGGLPVAAQGQGRPATLDRLGRSDEPIAFTADDVEYDEQLGLVTARGNVEIAQGDRVLKARTVSYNQKTRVVTASGDVVLLEPTGEVVFANYVELTDDLRDGFIEQVGLRLTNNARFAAAQGTRSGGERTEMRRGVYSLCELCKSNPTKAPLWQVKADRIVHDDVAKDITYRDAKL